MPWQGEPLRAISVRQPWAFLIMQGQKTLELRDWETPYRGRLVLHCAQIVETAAVAYFGLDDVELPTGAAVATVKLIDVQRLPTESLRHRWHEHRRWGPYRTGRIGFELQTVQIFREPVPFRGAPQLFFVPGDASELIGRQLLDAE